VYALRIAVPVYQWFLCRPEDLAFIGLLLLEDCVLDVDLFPDFGRSSAPRDGSSDDVVVGRGRGVLIKRSNNTSKREDFEYGRGREACSRREVSTKVEHL